MKLSFILFICSLLHLQANTYSQNTRISLQADQVSLASVLAEIENKSEFKFLYESDEVYREKVSIRVTRTRIKDILDILFKGKNISYNLVHKQIVLKKGTPVEPHGPAPGAHTWNNMLPAPLLQQKITGTVTDDGNQPLPGVTVLLKGTITGTQTDFDGRYEIMASQGQTLVFSYVGFRTIEHEVLQTELNVRMKEQVSELEEVVITGYSIQKRERVTGAAEVVEAEKVQGMARGAFTESLQGNASGLQVVGNSGQPGSRPDIVIRGVGSFGSSSPLYIVDGMQVGSGLVRDISPYDIESITVLKDAASTSIYGARAANGVIVITTKSAKALPDGKPQINYSGQTGFSNMTITDRGRPLNTAEYQELMVEGILNAGTRETPGEALEYLINRGNFDPDSDVDWAALLTRTGTYQQHDLSISGGSEKTRYFFSSGLYDQTGVILGTYFRRFNTRLKLDQQIGERIRLGVNMAYSRKQSRSQSDAGSNANPVRAMLRTRPDVKPYNDDGTYNLSYNSTYNPIALINETRERDITHRVIGGIDLAFDLAEGLTLETKVNANYAFVDDFQRRPANFGASRNVGGSGSQISEYHLGWTYRNMLRYDKTLGGVHNITAFAGYEANKEELKSTYLRAENYIEGMEDIDNASMPTDARTNSYIGGVNSWFSNLEYSYDDRYIASGSLRRDGSSNFGSNNKYGVFWSAGLGWNIHREAFMQNQNVVDNLKLRASYGVNGNDRIGRNSFQALYASTQYNDYPALQLDQIGNADLKWEENRPLDIGLEFGLFGHRISGSIDWYKRETRDLLQAVPISSANGLTRRLANIGSMENQGWEVSLQTRNIQARQPGGFEWTTNIIYTSNRNKVTRLAEGDIVGSTTIIREGHDFNTRYMVLYAGVDPDNGDALWYTDGTRAETTNNWAQATQGIVGRSTPDFYGSLRNTFTYKGISLGMLFYTNWGGLVYDTWGTSLHTDGARGLSTMANLGRGIYERRWQQPGDVTDVPRFVLNNSQSGRQNSSRYVYDGTYIRLRDVELAYSFPSSVLEKIRLSGLNVYLRGNNLWTWVKDDRLEADPEAGLDGRLNQRIPISKTLIFGLNVSL